MRGNPGGCTLLLLRVCGHCFPKVNGGFLVTVFDAAQRCADMFPRNDLGEGFRACKGTFPLFELVLSSHWFGGDDLFPNEDELSLIFSDVVPPERKYGVTLSRKLDANSFMKCDVPKGQ